MSKTRRAQEITVPQEWKKDEKKKPAAEMMCGGMGAPWATVRLITTIIFARLKSSAVTIVQTGVQKIKLIVQAEVADVKASPRVGGGFHAQTFSAN